MIVQHIQTADAPKTLRLDNAAGVRDIVADAAMLSRVPAALLIGPSRKQAHAYPRFGIIWVARITTVKSTPQIGAVLGGRDHTTILAALRKAEALRGSCPDFRAFTDKLLRTTLERICT